jgi:uncharacterized membrane protein
VKRTSVRRHLIAGLIVIAPVTATAVVLWWIFQLLDGLLGRFLYPALGALIGRDAVVIPGLGLLVLFALLVFIGWATQRAIGSRVVAWWHTTMESIPLTSRIYSAANRIVRTVFGESTRPFKKVVLVEYPAAGRWAIGFLSADAPAAMQEHIPSAVSVFVPTTPNPTSGFLAIIPADRVIELDMTIDAAFTFILSAGSAHPDHYETDAEAVVPAAGAEAHAPGAEGPDAHAPGAEGPDAQAPGAQGPDAQAAGAQGPDAGARAAASPARHPRA